MSNFIKIYNFVLLFIVINLLPFNNLQAELSSDINGELSLWLTTSKTNQIDQEILLRYLPAYKIKSNISNNLDVDMEVSANIFGLYYGTKGQESSNNFDFKTYRAWARLYSDAYEIKIGLQEISFGPAKILRSLRWFDQKISTDPTGFTDGVKAILFRGYLHDNSNFWIWGLYDNTELMGISSLKSKADEIEKGMRTQFPLDNGEFGITVHQRKIDTQSQPFLTNDYQDLKEYKTALDLKLDINIGFWLEMATIIVEENPFIPEAQLFFTMGGDYTFDVGNGLYSLVEVMTIEQDLKNEKIKDGSLTMLTISEQYSISLIDQVGVTLLFDASNAFKFYANWQRVFDDWLMNFSLYGNQVQSQLDLNKTEFEKGFTILIQYNH